MVLIAESAVEGNITHGPVVVLQELPRFGDAEHVDIFIKGNTDLPLECPLEARDAHPAFVGCFFQGELIRQMFVDVSQCLPHGIWVLAHVPGSIVEV